MWWIFVVSTAATHNVLERPVPVWELVLLVRQRTVPVLVEPHVHELQLLPSWERGHLISYELYLVCGWKIRSLRPHLMYIVPKWPDIRSRLGLVVRLCQQHEEMFKRGIQVRKFVLLVRCWTLPRFVEPYLHQLHLMPGWQ
eukprot:COSAG04_NODE_5721_length_1512_cov_2.554848_1_plen_141_part_00